MRNSFNLEIVSEFMRKVKLSIQFYLRISEAAVVIGWCLAGVHRLPILGGWASAHNLCFFQNHLSRTFEESIHHPSAVESKSCIPMLKTHS
jgi:hypothetical protein